MRKIEITAAFRRDFKREARSGKVTNIESLVASIVSALARDEALPERNRDHGLTGDWRDHSECHLKPDLLLLQKARCEYPATRPDGLAQRAFQLISAHRRNFHICSK